MLKNILFFVSGAALGAGITYAAVNSKYDKLYRQDWEEMHAAEPETVTPEEAKEALNIYGTSTLIPTENPFDDPEYLQDEVEEETENSLTAQNTTSQGYSDDDPYIITEDEYNFEKKNYEKIMLFYWAQDHVLADEEEMPADTNIYDRIGTIAIRDLESEENMYETYVRNDKYAEDYCITYVDRNWTETHE